jgi:hypothetical protein
MDMIEKTEMCSALQISTGDFNMKISTFFTYHSENYLIFIPLTMFIIMQKTFKINNNMQFKSKTFEEKKQKN